MANFYALKRELFLSTIAGVMHAKQDVPYLYDLLVHERTETRENMKRVYKALVEAGHVKSAMRLRQDADMMEKVYTHDIALLAAFMQQNDMRPF